MKIQEGDIVVIPRIEAPVKEIRGILKGTEIAFERESADRDESIDQAFTHKQETKNAIVFDDQTLMVAANSLHQEKKQRIRDYKASPHVTCAHSKLFG